MFLFVQEQCKTYLGKIRMITEALGSIIIQVTHPNAPSFQEFLVMNYASDPLSF